MSKCRHEKIVTFRMVGEPITWHCQDCLQPFFPYDIERALADFVAAFDAWNECTGRSSSVMFHAMLDARAALDATE